jgi:ribosomal protein S18 acetylase RimI-like enzyme
MTAPQVGQRFGTIWMLDIDEPVPAIKPRIEASFRQVGPESYAALAAAMDGDPSHITLKRFERGRDCYAAWVGDRIAAYGWVSFDEEYVGELRLTLRFLPGEAYIWDCVTVPAFRRNHLYSALLVFILGELRRQAVQRVWIGADLDNIPSQRGIDRAGFRRIADLLIAYYPDRRVLWVEGYPAVQDRLVERARRIFLGSQEQVWQPMGP